MEKVLVGFSGGVDSAMTALLLREQGHAVTAAMMTTGGPGEGCGAAGDAGEAGELAERLDLPFRIVDCSEAYRREVMADFRREYLAGRTPNPCVRCNAEVKFRALPELARAAGAEFDFFATGHYARISRDDAGRHTLLRGADPGKDQSYFLYRLSADILARTLFPLGEMQKADVRKMAALRRVPVHDKPDSQDFRSDGYAGILNTSDREGDIVDLRGKILGRHRGHWNFTIGQRKGLAVAFTEPLYVVRLEPEANRVVVGVREEALCRGLAATELFFPHGLPEPGREFSVRVRSTQTPRPARVGEMAPAGRLTLNFHSPAHGVAPGQSLVLYDGERVTGGGIIEKTW